jgi:hypothetical protein
MWDTSETKSLWNPTVYLAAQLRVGKFEYDRWRADVVGSRRYCTACRKSRVQTSARRPTVLKTSFVVFLIPSTKTSGYYLKLSNGRVHLYPFKLILWIRASQYDSVEITNKMQPCNRIYYSTVHWRLNMFRAAYRSSSGALTVFAASDLHTAIRQ